MGSTRDEAVWPVGFTVIDLDQTSPMLTDPVVLASLGENFQVLLIFEGEI